MVVLVKHVHWWLQYQWKWRFQCWLAVYLLFIYFLGYPLGYESELVLFLFEPQYAYCAHLCNCCEEKNHYNRLVNLSSCKGFLGRKIKGVLSLSPCEFALCPLQLLCPSSTRARSCLKNMLQYSLDCSWSSPLNPAAQSHPPPAFRDYLLLKTTSQTAVQGSCRQALLNNMAPLTASL